MALVFPLPPRSRFSRSDLPLATGLVAGLLLPLATAALFPTYIQLIKPNWVENLRHQNIVYLAGEVTLVMHARGCGYDPAGLFRVLPRSSRTALAVFLASYWISSVFVSRLPPCSVMLCLGWIVHLLFAGAVFHLFQRVEPERLPRTWPGFAAGLAALALVTLAHFTVLPTALRGREYLIDWAAAVPGFISVRHLGSWTGAVGAALTGLAWVRGSSRDQRLAFAGVALAFGLTLWSGTRAALLGWTVVLPVAWAFAGRPRQRGFWTELPLWCAGAAVIALLLQPYGHGAYGLGRPAGIGTPDAYSSGRLTLWMEALKVWRHYPLLGTGMGSSWWLIDLNGATFVQPHNALVQFLLNWGVIPTLPALFLLGNATWRAHGAARRHSHLLPFVLMLDCLLAMSMLEGMLHFAQFVMLIVGCLAICLAQDADRGETRPVDS